MIFSVCKPIPHVFLTSKTCYVVLCSVVADLLFDVILSSNRCEHVDM